MAELLIITRNNLTYSHRQMLNSARDLGHLVDTMLSNRFSGLPEKHNYDLILHRDSGVSYDDIDLTICQFFTDQGQKVVNSLATTKALRGKDNQFLYFKQNELPHIPTFLSRGQVSPEELPANDEFVLKTIRGNQGRGVMLLNSRDSLLSVMESNQARGDERYIVQPKLSFSHEYRVLIMGDEILGTIEKTCTDDFRANAKRSETKVAELNGDALNLVQRIQALFPGEFLGIDIGMTSEGPILIELNTTAGFEVFDQLHSTNIARKLLETYL